MKITIQKREPDKNGHRALRLVYYHGSKTGQNGSRAQKRSYEPLNLFLYDKPRLPAEREHNKTVNQKAEAIRAKRLLEIESWRGSGTTFSMKPPPNPEPNWPRTRPAVTSTRFGQRSTRLIGTALSATTRFNRSSPSSWRTRNGLT